jgi:hypothetical protein
LSHQEDLEILGLADRRAHLLVGIGSLGDRLHPEVEMACSVAYWVADRSEEKVGKAFPDHRVETGDHQGQDRPCQMAEEAYLQESEIVENSPNMPTAWESWWWREVAGWTLLEHGICLAFGCV